MSGEPLLRLQARTTRDNALILPGVRKVRTLAKRLRSRLTKATFEGVLVGDSAHLVWQGRESIELPKLGKQRVIVIRGGIEINRDRDPSLPCFKRSDGAWFDFHIHLRPYDGELEHHRGSLELLGYGYEIRFPVELGCDVRWLRFDLNHPGHPNEAKGVRSHFHPGDEELQAPSAVLHPQEALELLLSDLLTFPDKPRAR
jgi:hypothetical protein